MTKWTVKLHPDFFKDLDRLGNRELKIFSRKRYKIKENPLRQKHFAGGSNYYREPITDSLRLIYYVKGTTIWFLTIGLHDKSYKEFRKRLLALRKKYKLDS